ncbi:FRG1-like family-domain-containing protein [Melanogaster broomeanus]|nr:FRG1-like family-domain-containing protein [Melanogaster broomeanus]
MSTDKVRSTKLKFKGEKTKKKRKRDDEAGGSSKHKRVEEDDDPDTWVMPETPAEIRGPTFMIHPSDPSPISVNFDSTRNRIILYSLDKEPASEPPSLLDRVPSEVSQVWVTTRVAGSPTINLRTGTGEGKFLSCDKHGIVSADREARGPEEEWTPVVLPDGMVAFMNVYENYLSVDEVAGGTLQLRGDSEEVGFRERFWVKIQNKYKKEVHEEMKKREAGSELTVIDEASVKAANENSPTPVYVSRLHQAWGAGRSITSTEDKTELKRARKEGRLAEALLDRRSKLKRFTAKEYLECDVRIEEQDPIAFKAFMDAVSNPTPTFHS